MAYWPHGGCSIFRSAEKVNPNPTGMCVHLAYATFSVYSKTSCNFFVVFFPSQMFNLFAWALSLVTMATVIFGNYPLAQFTQTHTPLEYGIYDALSRVGWAIALCYIIFACVNNYGGPINWFLGHPLWQPVSRLCYSIYIVHFSVIMVLMGTIKTPAFFSELTAVSSFF